MENEINYIKLDDIIPNRFQPREVFDETALNELADSIKQHGVLEPIIVRQVGNKFEIIAGERRYKASALAGLTSIPAIVKNLDDKQSSIVAYVENAHRRNVSSIEEARTSERILKSNNMTQEQLAKELGISQSSLANKLRLLSLPVEVQDALMKNEISERHARSLLSVKDQYQQIELLNRIISNKMTVRELDSEIRNMMDNSNFNNGSISPMDLASETASNKFIGNVDVFNQTSGQFNQPVNTYENIESFNATANNQSFLDFANSFSPDGYMKDYYNANNGGVPDSNVAVSQETVAPVGGNSSFDSFLSNYDSNIAVSQETAAPVGESSSFDSFLSNYDSNVAVPQEIAAPVGGITDLGGSDVFNSEVAPGSTDFSNYLNNYDNSVASNAPLFSDVNPPITSGFDSNGYVENDSRFVDVSFDTRLSSLDAIINELKATVDRIKDSKFKVDTDEIDFDDMYQITIKIDKRDIL